MTISSGSCLGSSYARYTAHTRLRTNKFYTHISDTVRHTPTVNNIAYEYGFVLCCLCSFFLLFFLLLVLLWLLMSGARWLLTQHIYPGNCLMHFWYVFCAQLFFSCIRSSHSEGKTLWPLGRNATRKRTIENLKCIQHIGTQKWGCKCLAQ